MLGFVASVVLSTSPHGGTLRQELISAALQLQFPRLAACLERSHAKPEGRVVARVVIAVDGRVKTVKRSEAATASPAAVQPCPSSSIPGSSEVLSVLAALMLASPDAGAFTGTLDKELIMKGIRAQTPTARRCFEEPGGKLVVRFVIGPDGSVTESELAEPTTCSNKTVSCVLKAMKGVKTEPPLGGSVLVTYPFIIKMTGI